MQPRSGLRVGSIFGIPLYLHSSWFIIFALITVMLSTSFESQHPGWTTPQYWILGIAVSVLFFASVVFHELGHSVIAMRYKIPVVSITLFIIGGLAQIAREPESAKQEFNIAIAGPIASVALGMGFLGTVQLLPQGGVLWAAALLLSEANFILGVFNLIPGFPMDGGRILRAIVWWAKRDYTVATRIASRSGQALAYMMIILGLLAIVDRDSRISELMGGWIQGVWFVFIGWFLLSAAQESYAHVAIRNTLAGLRAGDIMTPDVPTVARDISIDEYVHEVLRTGRRCHVVTGNGMAVGLVTLHRVQMFPRDEWANTSIQAAMVPQNSIHWVSPSEPVLGVLERMQTEDINQMPVLQEGHIIGMIARDAILRVIQTRMQAGRLAEQ
ncbi:MAG TPA: site-2 protease family protein [Candidatus Acidoferrales bacterium]|nr:site-2 protease family protein [Candidatus Acidoferrales bacterium]